MTAQLSGHDPPESLLNPDVGGEQIRRSCLSCRRARVGCDRKVPVCGRCLRQNNQDCHYPPTQLEIAAQRARRSLTAILPKVDDLGPGVSSGALATSVGNSTHRTLDYDAASHDSDNSDLPSTTIAELQNMGTAGQLLLEYLRRFFYSQKCGPNRNLPTMLADTTTYLISRFHNASYDLAPWTLASWTDTIVVKLCTPFSLDCLNLSMAAYTAITLDSGSTIHELFYHLALGRLRAELQRLKDLRGQDHRDAANSLCLSALLLAQTVAQMTRLHVPYCNGNPFRGFPAHAQGELSKLSKALCADGEVKTVAAAPPSFSLAVQPQGPAVDLAHRAATTGTPRYARNSALQIHLEYLAKSQVDSSAALILLSIARTLCQIKGGSETNLARSRDPDTILIEHGLARRTAVCLLYADLPSLPAQKSHFPSIHTYDIMFDESLELYIAILKLARTYFLGNTVLRVEEINSLISINQRLDEYEEQLQVPIPNPTEVDDDYPFGRPVNLEYTLAFAFSHIYIMRVLLAPFNKPSRQLEIIQFLNRIEAQDLGPRNILPHLCLAAFSKTVPERRWSLRTAQSPRDDAWVSALRNIWARIDAMDQRVPMAALRDEGSVKLRFAKILQFVLEFDLEARKRV